jgi:hypothetical protein
MVTEKFITQQFVCILLLLTSSFTNTAFLNAQNKLITITIKNQSEETVLVKVIGPVNYMFELNGGMSKEVEADSGEYNLFLRFGNNPNNYSYRKGEPFSIIQTESHYTKATIILNTMKFSNYSTESISEEEFLVESIESKDSLNLKSGNKIINEIKIPLPKEDRPIITSLQITNIPLVYKTEPMPEYFFNPANNPSKFLNYNPFFEKRQSLLSLENIGLVINSISISKFVTNVPYRDVTNPPTVKIITDTISAGNGFNLAIIAFRLTVTDSTRPGIKTNDFACIYEFEKKVKLDSACAISNSNFANDYWCLGSDSTIVEVPMYSASQQFKIIFRIPDDLGDFFLLTHATLGNPDGITITEYKTLLAYCNLRDHSIKNLKVDLGNLVKERNISEIRRMLENKK